MVEQRCSNLTLTFKICVQPVTAYCIYFISSCEETCEQAVDKAVEIVEKLEMNEEDDDTAEAMEVPATSKRLEKKGILSPMMEKLLRVSRL